MRIIIALIFLTYQIITATDEKHISYIWDFSYDDDPTCVLFSKGLMSQFDSTLRECNNILSVTRLHDSDLISQGKLSKLSQSDYSILVENQANYLIQGNIWKTVKDNQLNVSIKTYSLIDSGNISVSSFRYSFDFLRSNRGVEFTVIAIVSEICPSFNFGISYLTKADRLFNIKKTYLDNYKTMVDSLLIAAKTAQQTCTPDTIRIPDIRHDTLLLNVNPINIDAVDILIPGYGLFTSLKKKNNVLHSAIFNIIHVSSLVGGTIFFSLSEHDSYLSESRRYKLYGSTLFVTSAVSAVVNGIVVAVKIKHQKKEISENL